MEITRPSGDPAVEMFGAAAERGTRLVDAQLLAGRYHRATLLVETVSRITPPGGRVLDYGCGAGRISLLLARKGFQVLGVDPTEAYVRLATAQHTAGLALAFRRIAPSETRDLEAASFDTILCSSVIEFVANPLDLLRRMRDLLCAEGRLVLSYANRRSAWRRYAEWRFGRNEPHFGFQRHVWRESQAWKVLGQAGFARARPTEFFESPFDQYRFLRPLSRLSCFGTLGLLTARRFNAS